jgi:hypothetical protein
LVKERLSVILKREVHMPNNVVENESEIGLKEDEVAHIR